MVTALYSIMFLIIFEKMHTWRWIMKCFLDVFFENSSLRWECIIIVNTGDTKCDSGRSVAPKKNFDLIRGIACERQTYFRSSLLFLPKMTSANSSGKTISVTWNLLFWYWPIRSKDRIQLEWPRALACLGFWPELPNTLWNVNFTTFTRFPAT